MIIRGRGGGVVKVLPKQNSCRSSNQNFELVNKILISIASESSKDLNFIKF